MTPGGAMAVLLSPGGWVGQSHVGHRFKMSVVRASVVFLLTAGLAHGASKRLGLSARREQQYLRQEKQEGPISKNCDKLVGGPGARANSGNGIYPSGPTFPVFRLSYTSTTSKTMTVMGNGIC